MEAGHILSADVLDIIFDQRNKAYGAYDLRKNYQRRLIKALAAVLLLVVLICITYVLFGSMKPDKTNMLVGPEVVLKALPPTENKTEPPPPLPKLPEPPKIKTVDFMKPLIAPDDKVTEPLPEQTVVDNAKIGDANVDGNQDDGIQTPVEEAKAVVEAPKKTANGNDDFLPVEIESQYPGGISAWGAFLNRNLIYPQDAADIGIQGTVHVQFIVDAEGNVSNVTAVSGPEELRSPAIAVIKKSGKWTPALQNGQHIKSYKKQPITFKIME